jgi:hypothetical protein
MCTMGLKKFRLYNFVLLLELKPSGVSYDKQHRDSRVYRPNINVSVDASSLIGLYVLKQKSLFRSSRS